MKPLPDILVSTTFWASVATLGAAWGAWLTFASAERASRKQEYESILNLVAGIEAEFELISLWAGGGDQEVGYLQSVTKEQLTKKYSEWFHPSRQIFSFDTPSLQNFTTTAQLRNMAQVVRPLVRLNFSIHRLFNLHDELRTFAHSQPNLFDSITEKMPNVPTVFTPEERVYMNIIFGFNLRIHQQLIGGADSTDDLCLYKAFRTAREAVENFKKQIRVKPAPALNYVLHPIAAALGVLGIWEIIRWLKP